MIEAPDFLPLGSVVSLKGNDKTLMIIGRAIVYQGDNGRPEYYDYATCLYPEGLTGDVAVYTNHDLIKTVHFFGYQDEEDAKVINTIKSALPDIDIPKANPQPISEW